MTARAVFSEARLLKLLDSLRERGLTPSRVRVERDGSIDVQIGEAAAPVDPFEAVDPRR